VRNFIDESIGLYSRLFNRKKIKDVFGYPGGMVTHLMDSFRKKNKEIKEFFEV